jgi:glucose/arabinose dehydrogenase
LDRISPVAVAAAAALLLVGCGQSARPRLTVVAGGLDNPRQLSIGPGGTLYVAEAGHGGDVRCTNTPDSPQPICIGASGAIATVSGGRVRTVVGGLPSVAARSGREASGPAAVLASGGRLAFVVQDTQIGPTGANRFGTAGRLLGQLVVASAQDPRLRAVADLARYEASHNPDHGAGATAGATIESDPYAIAAFQDGYAVADAAGNDLLWVGPGGAVRVLAVFPTQVEVAPAGVAGRAATRVTAQSVPTSVAVGPDGALYVSELTGFPFQVGAARVWRVVPGRAPTVYASGFTNISAIAFDRAGRLLVLEIDRSGLRDTHGAGELLRLDSDGRRTVLAGAGLSYPTGLAVGSDGSIYIANRGNEPAGGTGAHGEILRLS